MTDKCQRCQSDRIVSVGAKCSDLCTWSTLEYEGNGYVPQDVGIGGGDCVEFDYCLGCGQLQGEWPIPEAAVVEVQTREIDSQISCLLRRLNAPHMTDYERERLCEQKAALEKKKEELQA